MGWASLRLHTNIIYCRAERALSYLRPVLATLYGQYMQDAEGSSIEGLLGGLRLHWRFIR